MSPTRPTPDPAPPPALAAFLRGIERRAAVLAELQAGDAAAGDAAVAAAMQQWRAAAADMAMGEWPERFWALLLAQPLLRVRTPVALPLDATDRLGELGAGPRAALLLRLAAGLDEVTAAAVLGIAEPSYRLALTQALPRQPDGTPDARSWRSLRDQVHRRIRTLPPDRLLRLSSAREAVLRGEATDRGPDRPTARVAGGRGWLLGVLWSLLVLCVVALAATFLPGAPGWLGRGDIDPAVMVLRDMPAASHYGVEAGLISHRDFAQLADPAAAQAQDLAFHGWLAALPAGAAELVETEPVESDPPVSDPAGSASDPAYQPRSGRSETADAPG